MQITNILKRAYHSLILILLFCTLSCQYIGAQKKTPEAVIISFRSKYPGEKHSAWHTDRNGNYETHFKKKGKRYRADFSPSGQWIETENTVKRKELPKAIITLLENSYEEHKIIELEFVTHYQKGEFYDLELKPKGKDKFDLMVRADGQIIGRD